MSTPNPRSTGGHTYPLSAQQMKQRSASPAEYPCFMETGFYQPTSGCCMRCCITSRVTPSGEDTPKWAARAAAEAEAREPQRQPDFSKAELSPDKPDFFTHDVASGRTPDGAAGWRQTNLRVNMGHRGVPGSSDGHSIVFGTPSRDKQ